MKDIITLIIAIIKTMRILCLKVNLNISPSLPTMPLAAAPIAMLCGEIILPHTPPVEFAETAKTGFMPNCSAAVLWSEQNSALDEVSLPVRNTPSQPKIGEKNGKRIPVEVKAIPMVELIPE